MGLVSKIAHLGFALLSLPSSTVAGHGHGHSDDCITCYNSSSTEAGYGGIASTIPANQTISFGRNYAVLNLDLVNLAVAGLANTTAGEAFIASVSRWIDAVHATQPTPLTIFTRIELSNTRYPELGGPNVPFEEYIGAIPGLDPNGTLSQLYPAFVPTGYDIVLPKSRYYAGAGNSLDIILSSQGIDTVLLSGARTSGVIVSTAHRLYDSNYHVYVISDNVIESPPNGPLINTAILEGVIPKLPANVITLEQAIAGLQNSGPAVYY